MCTLGLGPAKGPSTRGWAPVVVIKCMVVIRVTGSLYKHSCVYIRVGPWALGPALIVVVMCIVAIRIILWL